MRLPVLIAVALLGFAVPDLAWAQAASGVPVRVGLVVMPYVGERNVSELSPGPELVAAGVPTVLQKLGAAVPPAEIVRLAPVEEREYGAWHRLALANAHLADTLSGHIRRGDLGVGVLANCSSLLGMLAGVQRSGPAGRPLRVGLVYIDAHGDFNTPETTLSGMLGGMPVAVAAGLGLTRLRQTSGLDVPLPPSYILLAGVRDADPLEQELIDRERVPGVSAVDLRERSAALRQKFAELAGRVNRIYVHVDMDVLDPREVSGHSLSVPGGPSSVELSAVLEEMFADPKVAAFGVASTPTGERDKEGVSVKAAHALIRAAVGGVQKRPKS